MVGVDVAAGKDFSVELLMRKTEDGNFVADISHLSEDEKRVLVDALKQHDEECE